MDVIRAFLIHEHFWECSWDSWLRLRLCAVTHTRPPPTRTASCLIPGECRDACSVCRLPPPEETVTYELCSSTSSAVTPHGSPEDLQRRPMGSLCPGLWKNHGNHCGQGLLEQTVLSAKIDFTQTPRNRVTFFASRFPEIKQASGAHMTRSGPLSFCSGFSFLGLHLT